jgi:hypothetical protein
MPSRATAPPRRPTTSTQPCRRSRRTPALVSPISGRLVFGGHDDLRVLLSAVYSSITGLRWYEEVGNDRVRVILGNGRVGPLKLGDAMVLEVSEDELIRRIRPHLRPWLALTLLAMKLGLRLAPHPGLLWRAVRHG